MKRLSILGVSIILAILFIILREPEQHTQINLESVYHDELGKQQETKNAKRNLPLPHKSEGKESKQLVERSIITRQQENTPQENTSIHPKDLIDKNEKNEFLQLNSYLLTDLTRDEIQSFIYLLSTQETSELSYDIQENIRHSAEQIVMAEQGYIENLSCSIELCAMLISGDSYSDIHKVLNALTATETLPNNVKGGVLRSLEADGIYFGLFLGAITDKPIKLN